MGLVTTHAALLIFIVVPTLYFIFFMNSLLKTSHFTKISNNLYLFFYLFAGAIISSSVATGWTFYTPLSSLDIYSGKLDFILYALILASAIISGLGSNFSFENDESVVETPSFYTLSVGARFSIFLMPIFILAEIFLLADRTCGTGFFSYPGGSPYFYQTIFWIFGHPIVYLLVLPISGLLVSFKVNLPFFGILYTKMNNRKTIAIRVLRVFYLSIVVWVHHLFFTINEATIKTFFMFTSLYIAWPMADIVRFEINRIKNLNFIKLAGEINKFKKWLQIPLNLTIVGFIIGGISAIVLLLNSTKLFGSHFVLGHFHSFFILFVMILIFCGLFWLFKNILNGQRGVIFIDLFSVVRNKPEWRIFTIVVFALLWSMLFNLISRRGPLLLDTLIYIIIPTSAAVILIILLTVSYFLRILGSISTYKIFLFSIVFLLFIKRESAYPTFFCFRENPLTAPSDEEVLFLRVLYFKLHFLLQQSLQYNSDCISLFSLYNNFYIVRHFEFICSVRPSIEIYYDSLAGITYVQQFFISQMAQYDPAYGAFVNTYLPNLDNLSIDFQSYSNWEVRRIFDTWFIQFVRCGGRRF